MSKIRKAHSVEIIEKRLKEAERSIVEPMELIGLQDELARVERKWREQIAEGSERRQPNDIPRLNDYFDRLTRQIEACLRRPAIDAAERAFLQKTLTAIAARLRV